MDNDAMEPISTCLYTVKISLYPYLIGIYCVFSSSHRMPASQSLRVVQRPSSFAQSSKQQSKKREANFPPMPEKGDVMAFQADHFYMVELDTDYWWPCLIVSDGMEEQINAIFGDIQSVYSKFNQLQAQHWCRILTNPKYLELKPSHPEATVLLGNNLNGYKKVVFQSQEESCGLCGPGSGVREPYD